MTAISAGERAVGTPSLAVESGVAPGVAPSTNSAAQLVGQHYPVPGFYEVGREKIREYARAIRDDLAAFHGAQHSADLGYPALVAPVTFTAILSAHIQQLIFEEFVTGYNLSQVLLTEQRVVVHRPVLAGDRLVCDMYLDSFREGHGQDVLVFRNEITDEHGTGVQTSWTTMVARTGGAIDEHLCEFVRNVMRTED